jgi:formylglycine-generating enzyme required for sulfatase activity
VAVARKHQRSRHQRVGHIRQNTCCVQADDQPHDPRDLRSASRFKYDYDGRYAANGFRVARSP